MLISPISASAQQATAPEAPHWETTANAGLTLTRGNSHTLLTTVGLDTKKKWDNDVALFGISGGYGKNRGERNTDFIKAYGQYNHLISERAYFGLRVDGDHDGVADLAYRVRVSPLLGYYLIKNEKTSLSFDVGPSVVYENRNASRSGAVITPGTSSTFFALRFGEKFEHKLTETTKIWQTAEYHSHCQGLAGQGPHQRRSWNQHKNHRQVGFAGETPS